MPSIPPPCAVRSPPIRGPFTGVGAWACGAEGHSSSGIRLYVMHVFCHTKREERACGSQLIQILL